jgi:hypothetical protein
MNRDELIITLKLMGYRRGPDINGSSSFFTCITHAPSGTIYRLSFLKDDTWYKSQRPPQGLDDKLEEMDARHLESFYAFITQDRS